MKKITYLKQALVLVLWIPIVILLFRFIEDKKVAAVIAGLGFVILPFCVLAAEVQKANFRSWLVVVSSVQFLIFFAVPIFFLRIIHWDLAFNDIYFFGVPAAALHRYSNISYLLLLGVICFESFRDWKNEKRQH